MPIRAAKPADKRAVREMLSRIWSDDYIPDVFDEWVRDRRGRLWVYVEDGQVVAIAKLTLLGGGEAWLHALRVDPGYQRRGIATALFEHRMRRARRLGARVARLDTHAAAVRKIAPAHGMRVRERYRYVLTPARAGVAPRLAKRADLDALWRLTRTSDGLLNLPYVFRAITRADIAKAIREQRCVVVDQAGHPAAMAIVDVQQKRLGVEHLAGTGRALVALARSLRAEAARRKRKRVGLQAPSRTWRAFRAAGYRFWDHTPMDIWEGRP